MRRRTLAIAFAVLTSARGTASADGPAEASAVAAPGATAGPTNALTGLGVVALPGATDAAWPLARSIYADPSLRIAGMDEAHARILCGEPAPVGAPGELRDLAETVAALRGEDAASRALLSAIARQLSADGIVVVRGDPPPPVARVFLTATGAFDAATYAPDEGQSMSWSAAARSLARTFGSARAAVLPSIQGPALAAREGPRVGPSPSTRRQFYESGWFWGALGAAAFAGGALYLATRDNGSPTIHLEMQVPH